MNDRCLSLLENLSAPEYYDFLKMALGMYTFLYELKRNSKRTLFQSISKDNLAEKREKNKVSYYYALKGTDFKNKTFHDAKGNVYQAKLFFGGMDNDVLECILRTAKSNLDWAELYPSDDLYPADDLQPSGEIFDPYFGRKILDGYTDSKRPFQFILGAGINSGFKIGGWDSLLKAMDKFVVERQRIPDYGDSLDQFKRKLANTNYVGPQLAENIDREEYFKIIKDWLYKNASNSFSNRESTNLYQVLRIASSKDKCSVLTFNYDDVFEQLANSVLPEISWTTVYHKMDKASQERKKNHIILHLHGYLPRDTNTDKMRDSIVLSSLEYMQAYRSGRMFCYSNLVSQLHTTNLMIGNSISDYEEQKVLRQNIYNNPSEFQFMLTTKNNEIWMDRCQIMFLMQMGVIPVYFNSFAEMNKYLQKL